MVDVRLKDGKLTVWRGLPSSYGTQLYVSVSSRHMQQRDIASRSHPLLGRCSVHCYTVQRRRHSAWCSLLRVQILHHVALLAYPPREGQAIPRSGGQLQVVEYCV